MSIQSVFKNNQWAWLLSITILGMAACTGGKAVKKQTSEELIIGKWLMISTFENGKEKVSKDGSDLFWVFDRGMVAFKGSASNTISRYSIKNETLILDEELFMKIKTLDKKTLIISFRFQSNSPLIQMEFKRKK